MADMSAKSIIEEKIAKRLAERADLARGIGAAVAIDLKGDGGGRWVIDCSKDPAEVHADASSPAVTTISMDADVFKKMSAGELDPQTAFLTGKVKVDGNLSAAIKLGQLLT